MNKIPKISIRIESVAGLGHLRAWGQKKISHNDDLPGDGSEPYYHTSLGNSALDS